MDSARTVAAHYPIKGIIETRPVLRHGEAPRFICVANEKERLASILGQVYAWQQEGFHSIALIGKTADQARKIFRSLPSGLNARLLSESDTEYSGGVLVLPASIVKGMEFDCVGVCDASAENFPDDEFLCRVLYVMMTRPLHQLALWYRNNLTPLLDTVV